MNSSCTVLVPQKPGTASQSLETEALNQQDQNAALCDLDLKIECPRCNGLMELIFNLTL
jgi:hypothetical protein